MFCLVDVVLNAWTSAAATTMVQHGSYLWVDCAGRTPSSGIRDLVSGTALTSDALGSPRPVHGGRTPHTLSWGSFHPLVGVTNSLSLSFFLSITLAPFSYMPYFPLSLFFSPSHPLPSLFLSVSHEFFSRAEGRSFRIYADSTLLRWQRRSAIYCRPDGDREWVLRKWGEERERDWSLILALMKRGEIERTVSDTLFQFVYDSRTDHHSDYSFRKVLFRFEIIFIFYKKRINTSVKYTK